MLIRSSWVFGWMEPGHVSVRHVRTKTAVNAPLRPGETQWSDIIQIKGGRPARRTHNIAGREKDIKVYFKVQRD